MKSSNATASAFGRDFQSNAAIMLMLKNIEEASKVKVEGLTEDIEITFNDGRKLMSQAKAVRLSEDTSHVKENLKKGLRTLNNAAKISDVEKLVFVTNYQNIRLYYCIIRIIFFREKTHIQRGGKNLTGFSFQPNTKLKKYLS
jgi:hypothetical protein